MIKINFFGDWNFKFYLVLIQRKIRQPGTFGSSSAEPVVASADWSRE
jgi:hypothetical protein